MTPIQVEDFGSGGWRDPAEKLPRSRSYCERLEEGRLLYFQDSSFLLSEQDRVFLAAVRQSGSRLHKNISYRPKQDKLRGFSGERETEESLRDILRRYSAQVTEFVSEFLAPYAGRRHLDFASFRPFEEEGRPLPWRSRNDLLHVDAFPTRPTNGDRILRVFTNVHPSQPRVWLVGPRFETLAREFAASAGLAEVAAASRSPFRPLRRLLNRAGRGLGLPFRDRSAYDKFMLRFHDHLKQLTEFQQNCEKTRCEFPPYSTWIAFTDMVPHAVLSGRFALEQTFIVSSGGLIAPENAPLRVLERLCGARLTN